MTDIGDDPYAIPCSVSINEEGRLDSWSGTLRRLLAILLLIVGGVPFACGLYDLAMAMEAISRSGAVTYYCARAFFLMGLGTCGIVSGILIGKSYWITGLLILLLGPQTVTGILWLCSVLFRSDPYK